MAKHARLILVMLAGLLVAACSSAKGSTDAASTAAGTAASAAAGTTALKVGTSPTLSNASLYLATQNGVFADHHLAVTPQLVTSGAEAVPLLLNGQIQFTAADPLGALVAISQKVPLVIVAQANVVPANPAQDSTGLLVKASSPIRDAADFAGKTIAVNALNSLSQVTTEATIDQAGGNASTVKFVELPIPGRPARPARPSTARTQPGTWNRGRPLRRMARISWSRLGAQLACIALAIGLWQLLVSTGVIPTSAVAPPSSVAAALGDLAPTGGFWTSAGATVSSWAIGLAISLAVAIPAGLALGASDLAYRMSRVSIDFLRTIPPVALIPLALLLYGATEKMALVLIIFGSVWPVLLQSMYGVHQVDPVARDVARSYQFRRRQVVFDVVLPSAAPFIATGIRIAATMSLLLAVGAELIGGAAGLGQSIALAEQNGDIPQMYAYIVTSAVLGVLLNLALLRGERRALRWHAAHRPAAA